MTNQAEGQLIGEKLRLRRRMKALSLKSVAERAGISIALLSQVERGLITPSIRSMRSICEALEMPVAWLFHAESDCALPDSEFVVRRSERRELAYKDSALRKEILTPDTQPQIQMLRFTLAPGADSGEPYANPEGAKCGYVLQGKLNLQLDDLAMEIAEGDSFAFPAQKLVRFWNDGDCLCEVLWVVTPAMV